MTMDYKYIEQLIERYWMAETSTEEEAILRNFFSQAEVPEHLKPYAHLFAYEAKAGEERLGDDFDARVLARIGETTDNEEHVHIAHLTWSARLKPLFRAAAVVAIVVLVADSAQRAAQHRADGEDWHYATGYTSSYSAAADSADAVRVLETLKSDTPLAVADSLKGDSTQVH